jgi:2-polyprenyl-3-methyl-5-hydroxy-6-metoxy-1,4-benzoquinol methylase
MPNIVLTKCTACLSPNVKKYTTIKDHSISGESFEISECQDCGFRYTANPPAEADCGRYYQSEDYISHSDTKKGIIATLYHKVRDIMLERKYQLISKKSHGKSLLDVGSGTGYFPAYMKDKGYHCEGIEVDDKARIYSRSKFGLTVHKPQALFDDTINRSFDVITLWHVLEHLYSPDRYMQRFSQLLTDDGVLIIALPNHDSFDQSQYKTFWAAYDVPRHLWHFHPKSFLGFAERNGFRVASMHDMPFDPFYNALLSEKYQGHRFGLVRGAWTGLKALIQGKSNVKKASSIIYVLTKK